MRDLIRNYKLLLKGKPESDSDGESQPLMSSNSSSSSSRNQKSNFGTLKSKHDEEEAVFTCDSDSEQQPAEATYLPPPYTQIPPVLLQKKQNRRFLYPSSYETPELEVFEDLYQKYDDLNELKTVPIEIKLAMEARVTETGYDYREREVQETNSSLVTIFAIWNTTVGTSLLSMSWGIEKTGLIPAIFINLTIAAICLYTTYLLLKINEKHGVVGTTGEVCDLCRSLIGRWAEILAKIFSLIVLIGSNIVYWILMSNFLYNSVVFFHGLFTNMDEVTGDSSSLLCPKNGTLDGGKAGLPTGGRFETYWDLYSTVPIYLAVVMFPMLNWKSPTFFTKFNSMGTFSVLYLIFFVGIKAFIWGVNMPDWGVEFRLKPTFCALSGMLSLSYFIHNIIISIMRNNRQQERNGRDLSIAFGLITFTYLFIGIVFYVTFPLPKFCIEDNILNNFNKFDVLTILARILLLFQLFTVFPLISYMLRNDIFANINMIFKNYRFGEFTYGRVIVLNLCILITCILFACFLPRIGTLIRYTGALSGLVYIFMLPSLLQIASLQKEGNLTIGQLIFYLSVIVLGAINLLLQFFINDS